MKVFLSARAGDVVGGYLTDLPRILAEIGVDAPLCLVQIGVSVERASVAPGQETRLISLDVSNPGFGPVAPEAVDRVAHWLRTGELNQAFSVAIRMLSRHDFSGTFRFIDREAIVRTVTLQIANLLSEEKPALVVFMNTPHQFGDYLLFEISKKLGISVLFFQSVPIAPVMVPKENLELPLHSIVGFDWEKPAGLEVLEWASSRIRDLVAAVPPPYISRQRESSRRAESPLSRLKLVGKYLQWIGGPRFPESIDFSGSALTDGFLRNGVGALLTAMLQRGLRRKVFGLASDPPPGGFALFALHYEPEKTSLPEGLPIEHQIDAVIRVRELLPEEIHLVVKEHYSQVSPSLRGFLGRSTGFYDAVRLLPNTSLLGPARDASDLFSRVSFVFTLTGTIAIEAVSNGIPVGYFGSPWWAGLPGTLRISELADLNGLAQLQMPSRSEIESFLLEFVRTSSIPGIASEEPEDYMRRNGELSPAFWEATVEAISKQISARAGLPLRDVTH